MRRRSLSASASSSESAHTFRPRSLKAEVRVCQLWAVRVAVRFISAVVEVKTYEFEQDAIAQLDDLKGGLDNANPPKRVSSGFHSIKSSLTRVACSEGIPVACSP